MTLMRYNRPYQAMPSFSDFFDNFTNPQFSPLKWAHNPKVNIKETEDSFKIEFAAPGVAKEEFNIEIKEGTLNISFENKQEAESTEEGKYQRREFVHSSFSRAFTLPENIDEEGIEARHENGILYISLPKAAAKAPEVKKVAVV